MSEHDRTGGVMRGRRAAADPDEEQLAGSDDLRYEGPIGFDDQDEADAGFAEERGGKVFLTAALLGAAVILLVGVALFLRRDGGEPLPTKVPGAESSANANVPLPRISQADSSIASENPAKGASTPLDDRLPGAAATTVPTGDVAVRPAAAPSPAPPPTEVASVAPVAESHAAPVVSRPEPKPAALTDTAEQRMPVDAPVVKEKKPASSAETKTAPGGSIHGLVAAGDLHGAAKAGAARAHSAKGWSLQVLYACKARSVKNAFKAVADDALFLVPAAKADCYRVLWGTYPNRADAQAAVSSVPDYFKKDTPRPYALTQAGK